MTVCSWDYTKDKKKGTGSNKVIISSSASASQKKKNEYDYKFLGFSDTFKLVAKFIAHFLFVTFVLAIIVASSDGLYQQFTGEELPFDPFILFVPGYLIAVFIYRKRISRPFNK